MNKQPSNIFAINGLNTRAVIAAEKPTYAPADYHRVQEAINDWINDLNHFCPALTNLQKKQVQKMLKIDEDVASAAMGIDEVTAQYLLVLKIRDMVLDSEQNFHAKTDARGLSALVNSINGVINLFLKHQAKLDSLREMAHTREAVVFAISELGTEVQQRFFDKLEELNHVS